MIKTKIKEEFPNHGILSFEHDIYVVDYTDKTKQERTLAKFEDAQQAALIMGVEVLDEKPNDIESFNLKNPLPIIVGVTIYDQNSFVDKEGLPESQCECAIFPFNSTDKSWVCLLETKYCDDQNKRKKRNLPKAINQLKATLSYLENKAVVNKKNSIYLIVSFPKIPSLPFQSSVITPGLLLELKRNHNAVLNITNGAKILSNEKIDITAEE